jgi:uncharacterized protein YacL
MTTGPARSAAVGDAPHVARPRRRRPRGSTVLVELVRLAVVVFATAGAYEIARGVELSPELPAHDGLRLLMTVAGAGAGYVLGGAVGRFAAGRVDRAEEHFSDVSSGELIAGALGALLGFLLSAGVTWPVLLFDGKVFTVPIAAVAMLLTTATGLRIGLGRGGDLLRAVGASGRLTVTTPSSGPRAKLVDTSALVDGRLLEVCRSGFLEGTLVVPRYVLYELQGLADAGDEVRRSRGQRGLDVLTALQRSAGVGLEVSERDHPELAEVDAKLVAMAKDRRIALLTVDHNLARVAEVQGVKVLNLHALAEHLRPPVLPGDRLEVRILKPGKEAEQGVGYLSDGTMVVVEGARERQGMEVTADVTSILSNPNGRMVFATALDSPRPLGRIRSGEGA